MSSARIWELLEGAATVAGEVVQTLSSTVFQVVPENEDDLIEKHSDFLCPIQYRHRSPWQKIYDADRLPIQWGERSEGMMLFRA